MVGEVLRVRYELIEQISEGPIFITYLARDRVRGRDVTVRVLRNQFAAEPEFVAKLRSTIERYARPLGHGIESMIELDEDEGYVFFVSEYTSSQTLQQRIDKLAPFSVSVAVSTAISICEALNPLHQSNLAHGDIAAQNIATMPDGQCRLQLAGIWEAYSGSQTAGVLALPSMSPYLAPEVSSGNLPSPSSDVYSVGILLYQLLSGRFPYSADTPVAMALKHATAGIPSVKIYNSAVPNALDEIVKKAMAKDPAVRYANASELLSDLRMLQDGLRFGKTLTWPLKTAPSPEKQPVAPKMSAIREEEAERAKKEREPRDVPIWLIAVFAFFAAVFLAAIGYFLIYNVSKPKMVVVPNIKGAKLAEAAKTLEALNLKIKVTGREMNDLQPPDTILGMEPPAGEKRYEGATISVKISTGSRYVILPDLRGLTMDKARAMLEAVNLTLSDNYSSQPDPKYDAGLISAQTPEPKAKVDRYARVSVVVSSGKSASVTGLNPDDDKQYLYNLKIRLTGLQDQVVLRVDIVDARGERTIYESPHQPDDTIEIPAQGYGKQATFKIYYDNQLVTTKEKQAEAEAPKVD
jgi:serine/threonine-protein kinase